MAKHLGHTEARFKELDPSLQHGFTGPRVYASRWKSGAPCTQAATSTLNPAEILQLSAVWVQGCPFTGLSTAPARGLRWVREQLVAQAGLSWAPLDWLPDSLLVVPLGFPGCHREKCALLAANLIL